MNTETIVVDFNGNNNVCSTRADGTKELIGYQDFSNWLANQKVTSAGFNEDDVYFNFQYTSNFIPKPIIVRVLKQYKDKYTTLLNGLYRLSSNKESNIIKINSTAQIKNLRKYTGTKVLKQKNNKGKVAIALFTLSTVVTAIFAGYILTHTDNNDSKDMQSQNTYSNSDYKLENISPEIFAKSIEIAKRKQNQFNQSENNLDYNSNNDVSYDALHNNMNYFSEEQIRQK